MNQAIRIIKTVVSLVLFFFLLGAVFGIAWGAFRLASRWVQSL